MAGRIRVRVFLAALTIAVVTCLASSVLASGFAVARFGGEYGHPTGTNPSVIYYNPAGLAFGHGHRLMLDANLALRTAAYDRPESALSTRSSDDPSPTALEVQANSGRGELSNFIVSPFIGFATDFGTDLPLAFGVGFFAPFGGQSVWDEVDPIDGAPGALDGPQRWYVTEGTIRTLSASVGFAYQIEPIRLSIGLAGNLYLSEINTIRARNSDGSDHLLTDSGQHLEGRSWLEGTSTDIGLGAGLMWEPVEDTLWVGLSYQSQPGFGTMELEGTLRNALASTVEGDPNETEEDIIVTQGLPDIFRLGFRYQPSDAVELRLFADYMRWSKLEAHCIANTATLDSSGANIDDACAFDADGAGHPAVIQNLVREWDDTFGVRVGGTYFIGDWDIIVGAGFDANAIPDEALEPALMDFDKVTASLGARWQITDWFGASLTATNVFYFERDTTGVPTADQYTPVSGGRQPGSQGIYEQNVFLLNTGFEFSFGQGGGDEPAVDEPAVDETTDEAADEATDEATE